LNARRRWSRLHDLHVGFRLEPVLAQDITGELIGQRPEGRDPDGAALEIPPGLDGRLRQPGEIGLVKARIEASHGLVGIDQIDQAVERLQR